MEKKRAKSHEKVEMRRMNNEEDRLLFLSKRRSRIYRKASDSSLAAEVAMAPSDSGFDPRQRRHLIHA
ncbi:hypothetical protein CK203_112315 [Vitis vinifera]|uniref:MADS-box domain-containing protein n=1 Tax=Vitis vinifera TaxID=29760 RepID=A0A438C562_VITVI|nr:hypothetical protein CK203_112315 [Vitis vinifera]